MFNNAKNIPHLLKHDHIILIRNNWTWQKHLFEIMTKSRKEHDLTSKSSYQQIARNIICEQDIDSSHTFLSTKITDK